MKRPRILIADDDPHVHLALRKRLSAMGYDVAGVSDGLAVLREYARGRIAAVILDHGMPNGDGRSIAQVIRNESDIPIVFLSGYDLEDFRSIVTQLQDTYYLSKPLHDRKLSELLASLIKTPRVAACAP